ncbi:MAG: CoA-transferase [Syntrophobacter sp.]
MMDFSLEELTVIEGSRYIADYQSVFAGTGLPLLTTLLAQKTHAPHLCFVCETGPISPIVLPTPLSVSDPRLQHRAVRLGSLKEVLGCMLQRGIMDVGFVGGAEIDQYGNINSTVIGNYRRPKVRFPGSGGANDILSHAKRILIITKHEKQRFPEKCHYITSPGYISGADERERIGLTSKRPPITIITRLGIMEINPATGRFRISKLMPGSSVDKILAETGFRPEVPDYIEEVAPPTEFELRVLREEVDPHKLYMKKV